MKNLAIYEWVEYLGGLGKVGNVVLGRTEVTWLRDDYISGPLALRRSLIHQRVPHFVLQDLNQSIRDFLGDYLQHCRYVTY